MRTNAKFGIKIFEIDFVIEGPRRRGQNKCAATRPIHASNSHTKYGWVSSNVLGGDSITDIQTNGWAFSQTDSCWVCSMVEKVANKANVPSKRTKLTFS